VALGVGFRVAPGVRLRATRRGPRVSLGPRIARVHLGGGRTAVSAGKGPFTVWSTLAGGGHQPPSEAPRSRRQKADEWANIRSHLDGLLAAHAQPVERTQAPQVPVPGPVRRGTVRRRLLTDATTSLAWWQLRERWRAIRTVERGLDEALAAERRAQRSEHTSQQAAADAWWRGLLANDPDIVTDHIERGLSTHELPATVTAVDGATIHLALSVLEPDHLIGIREPTVTDKGNLSLARMTKTRRHELYEAAISSAVVAAAAEAFALAPAIQIVDAAVVAPRHIGGPAVLMLVELPRQLVLPDGADRPVSSDLVRAAEAGLATLVRDKGGRIGALRALDPEEPEVAMLLDVLDLEEQG
jgi:hypothetical protein